MSGKKKLSVLVAATLMLLNCVPALARPGASIGTCGYATVAVYGPIGSFKGGYAILENCSSIIHSAGTSYWFNVVMRNGEWVTGGILMYGENPEEHFLFVDYFVNGTYWLKVGELWNSPIEIRIWRLDTYIWQVQLWKLDSFMEGVPELALTVEVTGLPWLMCIAGESCSLFDVLSAEFTTVYTQTDDKKFFWHTVPEPYSKVIECDYPYGITETDSPFGDFIIYNIAVYKPGIGGKSRCAWASWT